MGAVMKQTKEQLRFKRNESGEGNDVDDTNVTESESTAGTASEEEESSEEAADEKASAIVDAAAQSTATRADDHAEEESSAGETAADNVNAADAATSGDGTAETETADVAAGRGPVAGLRRWLEHGDARVRRRRKILSAAVAAVLAVAVVWTLVVVYNMFIKLPLETAQAKALQSRLLEEYGFDPGSIISDDEFFDGDALDAAGVQAVLDKRGAKCQGSECLRNYTETVESIPADELCEGYPVVKTDKNYKVVTSTSQSSSSSSKASGDEGKTGAASGDSSASKSSDTSNQSSASKTSGTSASDSDKSSSGTNQGTRSSSQSNQSSQSSNGSAAVKQSSGQSSAQSSSKTAAGASADTFTEATATHSAAEIIANAGKSCGISQKVLLVMLEKEQGLVSATKPTQDAYDAALGLSCPDGAACDSKYKGFFKQVYGAAERFRYYLTHEDEYGYYANRLNYVAFNPDKSCGGRNVWIGNNATALLYIYTPYQPNAAALAAGTGTGDACSSYGNRNFAIIYSGWFGDPRL